MKRPAMIANVLAAIDEWHAHGEGLNDTVYEILGRFDFAFVDVVAIKAALRVLLDGTSDSEVEDVSDQADRERQSLRDHRARLALEDAWAAERRELDAAREN